MADFLLLFWQNTRTVLIWRMLTLPEIKLDRFTVMDNFSG
nr:MAG TPA: hypothetical protein [Caudoviricetes sp.]